MFLRLFKIAVISATLATPLMMLSVSAQSKSSGAIVGKVRLVSGQAAANLIVELLSGTGAHLAQTVTANEGDYAFTGLAGGSYVVKVNDPRYQLFSERVEVMRLSLTQPAELTRFDITLAQRS